MGKQDLYYEEEFKKQSFIKKLVRWTSQLITAMCLVFGVFLFTRGAGSVEEAGQALTVSHGFILFLIVAFQFVGERMFRKDVMPGIGLLLMCSGPILLAVFFIF